MIPRLRLLPPPSPPVVVVRDRLIGAAVTGLLTVITAGVVYIARTVPLKFQEYDYRLGTSEAQQRDQVRFNERVLGVLERKEKRDDNQDTRLTRLEQR